MTTIARTITAYLDRTGITQSEFSERVGVVPSTICKLLRLRKPNPKLELLIAIADEIGITIDKLVGHERKIK